MIHLTAQRRPTTASSQIRIFNNGLYVVWHTVYFRDHTEITAPQVDAPGRDLISRVIAAGHLDQTYSIDIKKIQKMITSYINVLWCTVGN